MPYIQPSSVLRNDYNKISEYCHTHDEAVFLTKNGVGDLAVMSMETYEKYIGRFELYQLLEEGLESIEAGRKRPAAEVFARIERDFDV